MVVINCEPISKSESDECENVVVSDAKGYPFAILFMDLFYGKDDLRIYDKIKAGEKFQIKVDLVE
jgi:hypothetical protein